MTILRLAFEVAPFATAALLLAAAIGFGIGAERAMTIARSRLSGNGRPFIERLIPIVQAGEIDEALAACSSTRAILPDIGLIVLRTRLRVEADLEALSDAAVQSSIPRLTRRVRYVAAYALATVMLGAAGTLAALATTPLGAAAPDMLAALAPLAVALVVAAPLVVLHAFLVTQADALIAQVSEFARRLVNALLDRPDVRLGHR